MGRDQATYCDLRNEYCFNPRARMGRDGSTPADHPLLTRFNPRARMGRDAFAGYGGDKRQVSTHAPAWGATEPQRNANVILRVSTHAPAWGATSQPSTATKS